MKIGVSMDRLSTWNRWGDQVYRKMKEFGYDCTDFNMADTGSIVYTASQEASDAFLREEKALADAAGVSIHQVHGPWRFPPHDGTVEDRAERMEKMKASIRGTAILGAKYWVVHPIMPFGIEDRGTKNAAATWELNLAFMRELLQTAKEYNVTICLENMPFRELSVSSPDEIVRFIREINDEHFKMCFDTGHAEAFCGGGIGPAVREAGSEIRVFHIHDSRYGKDLHLMPYEAAIDWADFSQALRDIAFDGVFSLETAPGKRIPQPMYDTLWKAMAGIADAIANGNGK